MLTNGQTRGAADRVLRCWNCDQDAPPSATDCRHCGVSLAGDALGDPGLSGPRAAAGRDSRQRREPTLGRRAATADGETRRPDMQNPGARGGETAAAMRWSDADFERLSRVPAAAADGPFAERDVDPGNLDGDIARISRTANPTAAPPASGTRSPPSRRSSASLTGSLIAAFSGGRQLHRAFGPALAAVAVAVIAVATTSIDGRWNGREAIVDGFRSIVGTAPLPSAPGDRRDSLDGAAPSAPSASPGNTGAADRLAAFGRPPHAADGVAREGSIVDASPHPAPPAAPAGSMTHDQPDRHWDVRAVQHALAENGYYKGAVDGDVGPMTRRALRDFQRREGLPPTGRIDSTVVRALERQEARPLTVGDRDVARPSQ